VVSNGKRLDQLGDAGLLAKTGTRWPMTWQSSVRSWRSRRWCRGLDCQQGRNDNARQCWDPGQDCGQFEISDRQLEPQDQGNQGSCQANAEQSHGRPDFQG